MQTKARASSVSMRALLIVASCCLLVGAPAEWVDLFNGADLSGWVVMHDARFTVVSNAVLRLEGGNGWLRTERSFSDFDLELEWRALDSRYDSGIFIRAPSEGKPWPLEAWQINLRYNMLGGLVKGTVPIVPAEAPILPPCTWHKIFVRCRGSHIELFLDGERQWQFDQLDKACGYIGIQAEGKRFEFRNIRVRIPPQATSQVK